MDNIKTGGRLLAGWRLVVLMIVIFVASITVVRTIIPPPVAVGMASQSHFVINVKFFHDDSWLDADGERKLSQTLFDELFDSIRQAREFLLLDMFLFNQWQGPVPERHRALASELTQKLIDQKTRYPAMDVIVITDPINTVYGGLASEHLQRLQSAGIQVVLTDLLSLQDSNPLWSSIWRFLIQPFGNGPGQALPNPFGEGRVSVRSYLALLNFKANHRKLLIADDAGGPLFGWVVSANPHDGSSAHRNAGLQFDGPAVLDLLKAERALLEMSRATDALVMLDAATLALEKTITSEPGKSAASDHDRKIRILGESRIHEAVIEALNRTVAGDDVDLAMFYLSERKIIRALKSAAGRGVNVRVLLDINNDAFGRQKNGVPNRPVAAELHKSGVAVRWCATLGEQCHAKWLQVRLADEIVYLMGSANFTRRNLMDLNMETDVELILSPTDPLTITFGEYFDRQWSNRNNRTYSLDYEEHADGSLWLAVQYRFMEATGISTF